MLFLSTQDVFVPFLNQSRQANEFLEQPLFVSSAIDELWNTQQLFENSKVDEVKRIKRPQNMFSRDLAQINALELEFFSQLTVLGTVTKPESKLYSLFQRKFFRF